MWEMCVHFEGVRVFLAQTTCILQIEMFFFSSLTLKAFNLRLRHGVSLISD